MKIIQTLLLVLLMTAAGCVNDGSWRSDAGQDADGGDDGGDASADGGDSPDGDEEQDGGDLPADGADEDPVDLIVTAVLPSRGPVEGGTWANIIGSGFVDGIGDSPFDVRDVTDVWFGDNSAIDIEVIRDDMISVRTPPGVPGLSEIVVENPNGRVSLAAAFDYFETVTAQLLSPTDFSAQGGTPFTIEGTGFSEDSTVLVNLRPAVAVVVESSARISAQAPPGDPGSADVQVVNRNGQVLLFRAATYHPVPHLDSMDPASGDPLGGEAVVAHGSGFTDATTLWFDAIQAVGVGALDESQLSLETPAGPPGPVDLTVSGPVDSHTLAGGFVYLPPPGGALAITALVPPSGQVAGGQTVQLFGEGFSEPLTAVRIGGQVATGLTIVDDRRATLITPPGSIGTALVEVDSPTDVAQLNDGFRYFEPLDITSLTPAAGPDGGGTAFVIEGLGFTAATEVLFGGVAAQNLVLEQPTRLSGQTPAGPAGPVDVLIRDPDSQALLEDGFRYESALDLNRVEPDTGSQAGGTYVTLFGQGFANGMRVFFGQAEGSIVQVGSASVATARTPPGTPGEVAVRVEVDGSSASLSAGFSYIDPTNDRGGASGGPIAGSINISVLDGTWINYGDPVPDAVVVIDAPALTGLTDARGQVTFSGPSLVREVTVTVGKEGFEAITVAKLNAANLTVYLYPNEQPPIDPGTIEVTYSVLSGRVFGFKDIPGLPSGENVSLEARVNFTGYSVYSVPPYGGAPQGTEILEDGGNFQYTVRLGNYSLYALFGAYDSLAGVFTPALLGVRRGIQVISEEPVHSQNIVLTTPLDQSVLVHFEEPPQPVDEEAVTLGAYVSLDLGHDGIIYLNQTKGEAQDQLLTGLPEAAADSFLFVGLASAGSGYPYSYTFRRQAGDISDGVTIGPFLGFTELIDPPPDGELVGGRIAWRYDGPAPEVTLLSIRTNEVFQKILWTVVVPGDVTEVTLPEELLGTLPQGEDLLVLLYTANSPRFDFDRFNFGQLSSGRWTSYTVNFSNFSTP